MKKKKKKRVARLQEWILMVGYDHILLKMLMSIRMYCVG